MKLDARQLRRLEEERARGVMREITRLPIFFILEDIFDTYNIGGLFRLADALAVSKIYLVGETETPPNSRIKKASVGTYKVVPWEYQETTEKAIRTIRDNFQFSSSSLQLVAVEQHPKAVVYTKANYSLPIILIFGNESFGIKPETLKMVDMIIEIPMLGINKSLNVIVAASIVCYHLINEKNILKV